MVQKGRRWLDKLPSGSSWDRLYHLTLFAYAHRRLPRRNSGLFNDYLYFLKTSGELLDILRQVTSDKFLMKEFVQKNCGDGFVLDTIGVYGSVDLLEQNLPLEECVVKPTHHSGFVAFVEHGRTFLKPGERSLLLSSLNSSPYSTSREHNYRYLRRQLICEPMLRSGKSTKDYKIFCYRGEPKIIQVDSDRHDHHKRNLYTDRWVPLDIRYNFPLGDPESAPPALDRMLEISRVLSEEFEFVRVDFFVDGDRFYVGELTHCPESAHGRFSKSASERLFADILFDDQ